MLKPWWKLGVLLLIPLAGFGQVVGPPTGSVSALCSLPESNVGSLDKAVHDAIKGIQEYVCPECKESELRSILHAYHPGMRLHAALAPKAETAGERLGSDADWIKLGPSAPRSREDDVDCPVAVAHLKKGSARLSYLAVDHVGGTQGPDRRSRAVFAAINDELGTSNPSAIIVEGFSGPLTCEGALQAYTAPRNAMTEREYAILMALLQNREVFGGEPETTPETDADHFGIDALRWMSQYARPGDTVAGVFARVKNEVRTLERWATPEALSKWYVATNGIPLKLEDLADDLIPTSALQGRLPRVTNRLVDEEDVSRNRNILAVARRELWVHGSALIIYGRGHLYAERPALEAVFGNLGSPPAKCLSTKAAIPEVGRASSSPPAGSAGPANQGP